MGEMISIAEILSGLLGVAVKFVYTSLAKADKDIKEELSLRIDKLEENYNLRIDKLEENSRRDDETVKELLRDSEARMLGEITARIRNIVELHAKIEKSSETLTQKHENVLERISYML